MKKIAFLSLMILSFYNYSSGMASSSKKFVFQNDLPKITIHYFIGLLGIKACDSTNSIEIKTNAGVNGAYSVYLTCKDVCNIIDNYKNPENDSSLGQARNTIMGLFNVQLLVDHVKFCYQNLRVFSKSEKIAKFNKMIKLNMTNEKIKQLVWLTFNTAFPYLCFAAKRMHYDKQDIKNAFYKDDSIASSVVIPVASLFANLSENQRQHTLYKKVKKETSRRLKKQS